uniref:Uncharacterized protein n=1 Tax=Arundo donax TaxID=35708 RepID=A0A0A9G8W3_ARUDO
MGCFQVVTNLYIPSDFTSSA